MWNLLVRLTHRVGRRGGVLLFLGFLDAVYGLSLARPPRELSTTSLYVYVGHVAPLWAWALAWVGVGLICLVTAFLQRDSVAFSSAIALVSVWGIVNLFAWFAHVERAYAGAAVWLAFAGFILILAGWPEPEPYKRLAETERLNRLEGG
jgi:hypothetical protein